MINELVENSIKSMAAFDIASFHCRHCYQVGCMTRSPVEFKDSTMIGGILQILNIHYGSPFNEYFLLWFMMVSMTFVLSFTLLSFTQDLTQSQSFIHEPLAVIWKVTSSQSSPSIYIPEHFCRRGEVISKKNPGARKKIV